MSEGVFITDGHWRKALAAVRALGKHGIAVTVGETTRLATACFSRHCQKRIAYPSALLSPDAFVDFLFQYLHHHSFRMILPMEDATIALMAQHRKEISRLTYLPVVSHQQLQLAQRKDKVLQLAQKIGIPTPRTWFVRHIAEIETLKDRLPYPVTIKPRIGAGAVGVAYASNTQELIQTYQHIHQRFPWPLIQERIPANGPGIGASFLLDEDSAVKAAFVHQRLREYPVTGGASTLRISIEHHDVQEMGQNLLKAMNWFGIAMVEFKLDPRDGIPKLMEVNPRFWGSLALAVYAGINFPYLLYKMACGERFAPITRYRTGVQCRWLLPGDILHFIHNPRRQRLKPPFFLLRQPNLHYDILSLHDPLPVLGRLLTPLTFAFDRDMKYRLQQRRV